MAKKEMINDSKEIKGEGVLKDTLTAYDQYDMNKLNDPTGMHPEYQRQNNKSK